MNRQELLYDYQREAVDKLSNGKILLGAVGSGKSRTALAYYFEKNGGIFRRDGFKKMVNPRNLLIITTPKKRDDGDWVREMLSFRLHPDPKLNYYKNDILIDSWNNIKKYINLSGWDILFDEQHLNGYGAWAKAFLKIAKKNDWIVLTATPGDNYEQYLTIWLANGYFRNASEFYSNHCIMNPYIKFRKIMRYTGTKRLERLKENVLVRMNYTPRNTQHHADIFVDYDVKLYKDAVRRRWDVYKDQPMQSATEMCYVLRKIVNTSEDRIQKLVELTEEHPKSIIFYNFDYERDILLDLFEELGVETAEWTGHAHQPVPQGNKWAYICQYTSACEGWEATMTDTIVFFSQNYSYKIMVQAAGRIDRNNTPFRDLYYYHLKSHAPIDVAISKALSGKKLFNEKKFTKWED